VGLNAVRHGLCATVPVIPGVERLEEWEVHRAGILQSLTLAGHLETVLAERVALLLWRLRRLTGYETVELAESTRLLENGRHRMQLPPDPTVERLVRYEAHLGRQLFHTMHELEALQNRRQGERAPLARIDVHGLPDAS